MPPGYATGTPHQLVMLPWVAQTAANASRERTSTRRVEGSAASTSSASTSSAAQPSWVTASPRRSTHSAADHRRIRRGAQSGRAYPNAQVGAEHPAALSTELGRALGGDVHSDGGMRRRASRRRLHRTVEPLMSQRTHRLHADVLVGSDAQSGRSEPARPWSPTSIAPPSLEAFRRSASPRPSNSDGRSTTPTMDPVASGAVCRTRRDQRALRVGDAREVSGPDGRGVTALDLELTSIEHQRPSARSHHRLHPGTCGAQGWSSEEGRRGLAQRASRELERCDGPPGSNDGSCRPTPTWRLTRDSHRAEPARQEAHPVVRCRHDPVACHRPGVALR
jgi:hypothetical protein